MTSILFETHHLYYLPNFTPVIQELKKRGKFNISASIPQKMPKDEQKIFYDACSNLGIPVIKALNEEDRIEKIQEENFDVILVGNVGQLNYLTSKKTITVMVYHGIGLKQSYYRDMDDRINIRSVESQDRFDELKVKGHKNLVLTGFTKLDPLIDLDSEEVSRLRQDLGLDLAKKTILYAPSFYPSSIELLFPEFELLSINHNIIIKLHNFSWLQSRYRYQSKMAEAVDAMCENVHLLKKEIFDIIPYYHLADILVSDISSTLFEFLPLNKPIIQANCYSLRLKHRVFSRRFWKKLDVKRMQNIDFTYPISDPSELSIRVQFALDYPEEMASLRKDAHDLYLFNPDGKASSRLVDAIEGKLK